MTSFVKQGKLIEAIKTAGFFPTTGIPIDQRQQNIPTNYLTGAFDKTGSSY
jgi:hypothetical protein